MGSLLSGNKKVVSIKQPYHLITRWLRVSYADSIPVLRIYFPKKRTIVKRPTTLNGSFFCSNYLCDCWAPSRPFVAMCLQSKVDIFRSKLLWSIQKPIHRQYITFELLSCLLTASESDCEEKKPSLPVPAQQIERGHQLSLAHQYLILL